MNIINFNDNSFKNTKTYQDFINENPSSACLNIRASSASLAVPISNVKIMVSKIIDDYKVIFYEGSTDESGMINKIILPTPKTNSNDLDIPKGTTYNIEAIYDIDNINSNYPVTMYPNICVVQNINITPTLMVFDEVSYGN